MSKFIAALICAFLTITLTMALPQKQDAAEKTPEEILKILREGQSNLEAQLADMKKQISKVETLLANKGTVHKKISEDSLSKKKYKSTTEEPESTPTTLKPISVNFQKFGSRSFYLEHNLWLNWTDSAKTCRQMGGQLASIDNEEELAAITGRLNKQCYWLGINDLATEGDYVLGNSEKVAPFLKWEAGQPNNQGNNEDCIILFGGFMFDTNCDKTFNFICQEDDK